MPDRLPRPSRVVLLAAAAALVVAVVAGLLVLRSDDDDRSPETLVDGSAARAAPPGLPRGVRGIARVHQAGDDDVEGLRACLSLVGVQRLPKGTSVVERIGLDGRSLTFRDPRTPRLYGCDASARAQEPRQGGWCGAAVGTLAKGRLTDPRLDLANCRDRRGRLVAFAWLAAPLGAEWLALAHEAAVEYHRVAGGLPVRVASASAVSGPASAAFRLRAHGRGRDASQWTVRVSVAG